MTEHTPTLWTIRYNQNQNMALCRQTGEDPHISDLIFELGNKENEQKHANAEFIVRACNGYEAVLELAAKGLYISENMPYTMEPWEDRSELTRQYWRNIAQAKAQEAGS